MAGVTNGFGQLTAVSNSNSTTQFTAFDALGRVTGSQQQPQGQIYTFSYTYNLAGSLATETYPSARVVTTTYDAANRPYTLAGNLSGLGTSYVTQTTYWPNGGVNALMRGNALVHSETYNSRLQLATATEQVSGGAQLLGLGLSWVNPATNNNNGTLQSVTATTPGLGFTQAYAYDALNRVTAATETSGTTGSGAQNWAQSCQYDAYGNMWMPSTSLGAPAVGPGAPTANVYSAAGAGNNRNATLDAASGYDKAGNLLNFGSASVSYDGENRQVTAGSNGYYYDGFGQRIGRMAAGVPTVYVYDAFGLLASEYSTGTFTYACATCYLAGDHLGSTRIVTDGSANVVGRHDYAPFGQEIMAGVGGRVSPWGASDFVNQKFTGQERDAETNLDFFQARYLASGLGRFMSPDPGNAGADFTNPQSWNGYVLGNPLGWVDPSGRDTCLDGTYASVCVSAAADPVDVSNGDWWDGLNWAYDPYSPLFTVTHTEKVTMVASASKASVQPNASNCVYPSAAQRFVGNVLSFIARRTGRTVGYGTGGSIGAGRRPVAVNYSLSMRFVAAPDGTVGKATTYTPNDASYISGGTTGFGGLFGLQLSGSNAGTIGDLSGNGVDFGRQYAYDLGAGVDVNFGSNGSRVIWQTTLTLGFGAGGKGSAGVLTQTMVTPFCQ